MTSIQLRAERMVCSWMGLASTKPAFSISANNSADEVIVEFQFFLLSKEVVRSPHRLSMRENTDCIGSLLPGYLSQDKYKKNPIVFMEFPSAKMFSF